MTTRFAVLGLAALVVAGGGRANAHSFPKKAPALKAFLVQNYPPCTTPDSTTSNGQQACVGSSEVDPSCLFSEKGVGTFTVAIKKTKMAVNATLAGLDAQCNGKTLTAALTVRTTSDSCPDDHCTAVDKEIVAGTCTVGNGKCSVKATLDPQFPAGSGAEMTILKCGVKNGDLETFGCGVMIK